MSALENTRLYRIPQTVRLAVGASSANAALPELSQGRELRIAPTTNAYIAFGDNAVAATTSSLMVFGGIPEVVQVPASATHFAVIQDSTGGFVNVTPVG